MLNYSGPAIATVAAAAITSALLSGCEAKSNDPAGAVAPTKTTQVATLDDVMSAFHALGDTNAMAVTVSTDIDDAVVSQILKDEDAQTQTVARKMLGGSATFALVAPDGTTLNDPSKVEDAWDSDMQFTLKTTGDVLDLRYVDGVAYGAVGLKQINELAGTDVTDQARSMATGPFAEGVNALIDGKHVSLTRATLEKLAAEMDKYTTEANAAKTMDEQTTKRILDGLAAAVEDNAKVSDAGDGYVTVTAQTKGLLNATRDVLVSEPQLRDLYDESQADIDELAAKVPTVKVDVRIVDGEVEELRLDLGQFASLVDRAKLKLTGEDFDLVIGFDEGVQIDAPSDAVAVDAPISQLLTSDVNAMP